MKMASSDSEAEIFEVDRILEKRGRGKNVEYFIRWKGFGVEEDSWEPAANIAADAGESITVFNLAQEALKTPRRQSKSRFGAGDADVTVEKSTKKTASGAIKTITTTTKKTVTTSQSKAALSDMSSPESSPVVTRRSLRSEQTKVTRTQEVPSGGRLAGMKRLPGRALTFLQVGRRDLPIMVLITCLLVIASSFYLAAK